MNRALLCALSAGVFMLPFDEAAAQHRSTAQAFCVVAAAPALAPGPAALQRQRSGVLYDQTGRPSEDNFPSQQAGGTQVRFDAQGGDDFTVPDGEGWVVSDVSVLGAYAPGATPVSLADVYVYADAAGRPGSLVLRRTELPVGRVGDGDLGVAFTPSLLLNEGTYWFSLVVDVPPEISGQWRWNRQATARPIGAELHWRNPLDGFGTGCTMWEPLGSNCVAGGKDASFRLNGEVHGAFFQFSPDVIVDSLEAGEAGTATVTLSNSTDRPLSFAFPGFRAGRAAAFVTEVSAVEGTIPAGSTEEVVLTISSLGLRPGTYTDSLEMTTDITVGEITQSLAVEVGISVTVTEEGVLTRQPFALRRNYPNPFAEETTVEVMMSAAGPLTVEVYDTLGRRVAELVDAERSVGLQRLTWDAHGAATGVYFVHARAGSSVGTLPVSVVR